MNLEDLVEAHLVGDHPDVPEELREEFERAIAGHDALQYALGETTTLPESPPKDRPPPTLPADYEMMRELGSGGMGVVYLVRQKSLRRLLAVKVLRPGEATFGRLVKRFLEEARHLARLRHPNIVSVHEVGHAGDEPYFTMDYVEGESLSAILARERLSPSRALALLKQAAEGVQHAHAQGIIHRDLKPGNILVDAMGKAYVTDFGLARDMTQTSKLTRSGEVMGTPAYMAPEQAQGQTELVGEATDVHALGVILYEMLTGRPPYGFDAPANVLVRLLKEEPLSPRRIDRRIPKDLETICLKALAKAPDHRYPTVRAFLEDLHRFEAGEAVKARRPGPVYHATRFARRYWKLGAAVIVTAAVLLLVAPRFFDKSVEQLVAVADEQRAAGELNVAVHVYLKALTKANGAERRDIIGKLLSCCDQIGDEKSAIEACRLVLQSDPDVSFGKYDYLVAQDIITQARSEDGNHSIRYPTDQTKPLLELARKRFNVFLAGSYGSDAERKQAAELLTVLDKVLAKEPFPSRSYEDQRTTLPKGTAAELVKIAGDTKAARWDRGKAAYAAGLTLEEAKDTQGALSAFRQGYDLMRSVYPIYQGTSAGIVSPRQPATDQAPESRLLKAVFESVQRLGPSTPDAMLGGLRIQFKGVQIPDDLTLAFEVTIFDPEVKDYQSDFVSRNLSHYVSLQPDQTARIGVADGRYRFSFRKAGWSTNDKSAQRLGTLLELDSENPRDIEIKGKFLDLVVQARLAEEITILEPAQGGRMDLRKDFFRWTAVKDASYYQVDLAYMEDTTESSTYIGLGSVKSPTTTLCLSTSTIAEWDLKRFKEKLLPGRTGMWSVVAFDKTGRRVGTTLNSRPFFVARELGE